MELLNSKNTAATEAFTSIQDLITSATMHQYCDQTIQELGEQVQRLEEEKAELYRFLAAVAELITTLLSSGEEIDEEIVQDFPISLLATTPEGLP